MKVLITGGTGFIGSALQSYILSKGGVVHYLTKNPKKIINEEKVKGFLWNTLTKEIDSKAFEGVDCIINLAGKSINCVWNNKNKRKIIQSRIDASETLYQYLATHKHKVKQIVNAAAIGIYPSSFTELYTEESKAINPEFLGDVCVAWEKQNTKFENLGLINSFIRIGLVLSKAEGALPEMARIVQYNVGEKLGSGKQIYSWIHINDLVKMFHYILENRLVGVFNGVSNTPIMQKSLHAELANVLNKRFIISKIPEIFFKIALGKRSVLLLDSHNVSNKKIINNGFQFQFTEIKSALNDLYK